MKNIFKCVIIDDEQHAIDLLKDYMAEFPSLYLYQTYRSSFLAMDNISIEDDIDIVFLDINMPGISGIELAKFLRGKTKRLIFVTAHAEYAVDAFELRADHYLLKPIRLTKFNNMVSDIIDSFAVVRAPESAEPTVVQGFFFIKGDEKNKWIRINMDDIVLVEGLKNYITIYTKNEKFTTYLTLTEVEKALEADGRFMRVHKSFIVKMEEIQKISGNTIYLNNDREILLGGSYKEEFGAYLKEYSLKTGRK